MDARYKPLLKFLRLLNARAPGDKKYRLDGVSAKTVARWFGEYAEPDPVAVEPNLSTLEAIGRGCARWFLGGQNLPLKTELYKEILRYNPATTPQPEKWTNEQEWAIWFRWLWEQCQKPLDFLTWDEAALEFTSVLLPPRLPVPGGARFRIRLYLEKPGWCLLVWVDGHGTTRPFGLDGGQSWDSFRFVPLAGERLLGAKPSDSWNLSDQAGAETIVLLSIASEPDELLLRVVRECFEKILVTHQGSTQAAFEARTKAQVKAAPIQAIPLERAIAHDWPRASSPTLARARPLSRDRLPRFDSAAPSDRLQCLHEQLRVCLTPSFDRTVVLSFANAGA